MLDKKVPKEMEPQTIENWMQKAFDQALEAAKHDEVPIGAILVANDEIIGLGHNARREQERTVAHAEIVAVEDYNRRSKNWRCFPGTSLFVTVEPCLMCTGAMLWARVDNIYYGCDDPQGAGLTTILPLIEKGTYDHRFEVVQGGISADRSSQLITNYFTQMRERNKSNKKKLD